MKRKKKKVSILSLLALAAVLFTACATDDAETDRQNPKQKPDTAGLTAFSVNNEALPADPTSPTTRVVGEYTGTGIKFYWNGAELVGVGSEVDSDTHEPKFFGADGSDIRDQLKASGKDRTSRATFWFHVGELTASQYPMRYSGDRLSSPFNEVWIEGRQEQTKPNDAPNLSRYGDCGTGTAHRQADGNYTFMIDHKASYITFLPYTLQKGVAKAKIKQIKVTADKAVCEKFEFDDNGINLNSRPATTVYNNYIELKLNDFPIPMTAPDADANAAIMVIAPGTYSKFTVEYTLCEDINSPYPGGGTDTRGTITKEYENVTLAAGKNKIISQNLEVPEYPADTYYMWDAAVGQHYWKGYEWNSAIPEQDPFFTRFNSSRTHYPKDNTDLRWYRELPAGLSHVSEIEAARSCKNCPNINELCWYVRKGDAYWDNSLWVCMDHLYRGGTWIKKLSVIAKENGKTVTDLKNAAPDGKDYRKEKVTTDISYRTPDDHLERKPVNINDYFYLPDLGFYYNGAGGPASIGDYWSSTPFYNWDEGGLTPNLDRGAYELYLYGTHIEINSRSESTGCSQMWPTDR